MGIISDVKCGRCDRRYSGLRGRCPYCGARRGKRGKHANDTDNSKGKLIIGSLLILILIVAVIVLVVTSANEKKAQNDQQNSPNEQHYNNDDDVSSIDGAGKTPSDGNSQNSGDNAPDNQTPNGQDQDGQLPENQIPDSVNPDGSDTGNTADPGAVDSQPAKVTAVVIKSFGSETSDFTINQGQKLELSYETTPADAGTDIKWKSSDENVFVVLQTGELTALKKGTAILTLTVDGITAECIVRVN